MDDAIRSRLGDTEHIRIICRTGNPLDFDDLGSQPSIRAGRSSVAPDTSIPTRSSSRRSSPSRTLPATGRRSTTSCRAARSVEARRRHPRGPGSGRVRRVDDADDAHGHPDVSPSRLSVALDELFDYNGDEIHLRARPRSERAHVRRSQSIGSTSTMLERAVGRREAAVPTRFPRSCSATGDGFRLSRNERRRHRRRRPVRQRGPHPLGHRRSRRPLRRLISAQPAPAPAYQEFDRHLPPRLRDHHRPRVLSSSAEAGLGGSTTTPSAVHLQLAHAPSSSITRRLEGLEPHDYDHVVI